jgi:hypothetical protein
MDHNQVPKDDNHLKNDSWAAVLWGILVESTSIVLPPGSKVCMGAAIMGDVDNKWRGTLTLWVFDIKVSYQVLFRNHDLIYKRMDFMETATSKFHCQPPLRPSSKKLGYELNPQLLNTKAIPKGHILPTGVFGSTHSIWRHSHNWILIWMWVQLNSVNFQIKQKAWVNFIL